eukprot:1790102-Rhodomonas_salina.1
MSREVDRQHSAGHAIARAKSDRRVYLFQYACDTLVGVETEVQCLQSARLSHPHLHCDLVVAQPASDCRALHRWEYSALRTDPDASLLPRAPNEAIACLLTSGALAFGATCAVLYTVASPDATAGRHHRPGYIMSQHWTSYCKARGMLPGNHRMCSMRGLLCENGRPDSTIHHVSTMQCTACTSVNTWFKGGTLVNSVHHASVVVYV